MNQTNRKRHNDRRRSPAASRRLIVLAVGLAAAVAGIIILFYALSGRQGGKVGEIAGVKPGSSDTAIRTAYLPYFDPAAIDIEAVSNPVEKSFIRYGKKLVMETPQFIGPEIGNRAMRFSGNNLACSNCHLDGGMRPFASPFVGVWGTYPNFRGRDNILGTLEDRINGCMERSMNGRPLPVDSREMKAMLAYIKFVNKQVPIGEKVEGQGLAAMTFPDRAADLQKGGIVFRQQCSSCHGENGQGLRKGDPGDGQGYLYPPLWGPDSFNDGAGMHRLLTAARFIKANMPYGTPVGKPALSDEEAYDVAAYINSFPRPEKAHKEKDYPDLKLKPQDCPYPPYADTLPVERHRLGPFVFNRQ